MKFKRDQRNKGDGLKLLRSIRSNSVPLVFFDPQYREIMDKMAYGNEGARQKERAKLPQMSDTSILEFLMEISRVLRPSGHVMWWVDKFILCEGWARTYAQPTSLEIVDHITWEKPRIGMGYRTRRKSEHLLILQKLPKRAKGVWTDHSIPDVWSHDMELDCPQRRLYEFKTIHPHAKPHGLQSRLIQAVTKKGQLVVDPCAGGYSVMAAANSCGRHFMGTDLR